MRRDVPGDAFLTKSADAPPLNGLFRPQESEPLVSLKSQVEGSSQSLVKMSAHKFMTDTGMNLPPTLSYDEWEGMAPAFKMYHSRVQWAIGDWLIFGEDHKEWGEMYSQAINDLDYDYDYLRQLTRVCRAYPKDLRRKDISFSHHREALTLPEEQRQNELTRSLRDGESVADFKERLREQKGGTRGGGARLSSGPKKEDDENAITVVLPKPKQAAVVQAAHVAGASSISQMLDGIADGTLTVAPVAPLVEQTEAPVSSGGQEHYGLCWRVEELEGAIKAFLFSLEGANERAINMTPARVSALAQLRSVVDQGPSDV